MGKFVWTKQLMRRATKEFPCIECGCQFFHADGCSRGINMPLDEKNELLDEWGKKLQKILDEEKGRVPFRAKCSLCRTRDATGTVWVAYHNESSAVFIVFQDFSCDECAIEPPSDWTKGRRWGFAHGLITKKDWELTDWFEKVGIM